MTSLMNHVYVDHRENVSFVTSEDQRLTLAYEQLDHMPYSLLDSFGSFVRILDLSVNKFQNLQFLAEFPNLTSLILDHNEVDSDTIFPYMPNLQLLWLNHNRIGELFPFIRNLFNSCPKLRYLSLMGNPAAPSYLNGGTVYEHLQYRLFVISWFPFLIHLDDRYVTVDQRREAERMFRRPLLERLAVRGGIFTSVSALLQAIERYFKGRHKDSTVV